MHTLFGLKTIYPLPDGRWAKQNSPNKAPPSHTPSGPLSHANIQNLFFCCENNVHHSQSKNRFHHRSVAEKSQNRCCHRRPNAETESHANQRWRNNSGNSKLQHKQKHTEKKKKNAAASAFRAWNARVWVQSDCTVIGFSMHALWIQTGWSMHMNYYWMCWNKPRCHLKNKSKKTWKISTL